MSDRGDHLPLVHRDPDPAAATAYPHRTPLPDEPPLAAALRACANGFYPAEAAAELLISHASWLCRDDFRDGFVDVGTSITDGTTLWP